MTISADYAPNIDLGNGTTRAFAVDFPFADPADLAVTIFDMGAGADIVPPPVLNGSGLYDYSVTGTPNDPGTGIYPNGTVTFNTAPLGNTKVIRARATPERQEVSLIDNARFPAKAVEGGLDHLELQIQEMDADLARAIKAPVSDGPVDLTLPPAEARADTVLTFDDQGNIANPGIDSGQIEAAIGAILAGVAPAAAMAGWAATLAAAQVLYAAVVVVANGQAMVVAGRNTVGDGYEGTFTCKAADSTTVFPASGLGFVDAAGRRWFRVYSDLMNAKWFGARGDGVTDDWAALNSCWTAAIASSQAGVFVPAGVYMLSQSLNVNNASLIGASEVGTVFKPMQPFAGDAVLYLDGTRAGGGGTDARYTNFRIHGNRANVSTVVAGLKLIGNVLYNTFTNIRIEEVKGAGVLLDAAAGPVRPTLCTFTNVHVSSANSHGWYFKAGRNLTLTDCASEAIGGKGVYFSGETESLSKIENARMYLENIAGDGIFLGDGDEFRTISPLVNGYGNDAVACFGYRVDGSVTTYQTYLYGGQFAKNPTLLLRDPTRSTDGRANINSKDFRFAAGGAHVIENGFIPSGQIDIPLNAYPVQIRGNRFAGPVSAYPIIFTNGGATLATNSATYLGAFTGAQHVTEAAVRYFVTGYTTLSSIYAECDVLPGGTFQYQVQIFVDGVATNLLCVLTSANNATNANFGAEILVTPTSFISCRVLIDNGATAIPQYGLHVTVGMRA